MRKKLSILLSVILLTVFLIPSGAFAMENKDLEKAISTVKSMLNITDDYDTFSYGINKENDLTVYNFNWRDSKQKLGEISASIDSLGRLTNYYTYKPYTGMGGSRLPSVSKLDAFQTSNNFIKKVNPTIVNEIKYHEDNSPMYVGDTNYHFSYYRVENEVLFPANTVNVSVDNRTGEVTNYSCNWTDGLSFPDLSGILTADKAQQAFAEKIGLKLVYKLAYDNDETTPYLAYNVMSSNKCIDAKTGEITTTGGIYYGAMDNAAQKAEYSTGASKEVSLSPEEIKALENAASFIDEAAAESTARKILNLDEGYKLESINLYKVWQTKSDYIWNMNFTKQEKSEDKPGYYYNANASVDAKTGEITSFYRYVPYDSDAQVKYDKDQSKKIAEDFIKSLQPEKFSQVEYTNWNNNEVKPIDDSEMPRQYDFTFTRQANNVYFPGNGFTLNVDTTTGVVTNYNYTWYKEELPLPDKVITLDQANKVLFDKIGLNLQYITDYSEKVDPKGIIPSPDKNIIPDVKLVYTLDNSKTTNIDANTGNLLDYSGKPYVERTIPQYTDISGDPAENAIKVLAQYGICLPGSKFNPTDSISQRDFLYLIAKSTGWYSEYTVSDSSDDDLYKYLTSSGVIKEGERNPSSAVAREDAARFIVRALRYDRVAQMKALFALPFNDSSIVSSNYYGYVAIAYGLGVIGDNGGYFNPLQNITRADAARYIYKLLDIGF